MSTTTNALTRTDGTLPHRRQADAWCSLARWQHFCAWNDVMAAILKVWRHTKKPYLHDCKLLLAEFGSSSLFHICNATVYTVGRELRTQIEIEFVLLRKYQERQIRL